MFSRTAATLGMCVLALALHPATAADHADVDMTCDDTTPVIMLVAGRTLDAARMLDYAKALQSSDLYPTTRGYYLNVPRPVRVLEGEPHADDVALMVRFPSECAAVAFWYDEFYQNEIKPMRLNPSAGDYVVTVYKEAELPSYMADKVNSNAYIDN